MEPLDEDMFRQKLAQVGRQPSEKDRARLVRNLCENFTVSSAQALALTLACHDSASKMEAGAALYAAIASDSEKASFARDAPAALFKFEEDRTDFCAKLGVAYEAPAAAKPDQGPRVARFDKHSTSGYTI